jgi:hypothetical protein
MIIEMNVRAPFGHLPLDFRSRAEKRQLSECLRYDPRNCATKAQSNG